MPKFSKVSADRLITCHAEIQSVLNSVIEEFDFTVVDGYRGEAKQNQYYEDGKSKLKYPHSRHNSFPSEAVDICPYVKGVGLVWDDNCLWMELAVRVLQEGHKQGVRLKWGGTWKNFVDKPHFELIWKK